MGKNNIYEIKDDKGINISARNTRLRVNNLKLKNSKRKTKKYWEFIPIKDNKFYIKNIYFNSYLFSNKDLIYLSKTNKSVWDIQDGNIKKDNKYLSKDFNLSKTPFKWDIEKTKYINYIIYIELSLIIVSFLILILLMIIRRTINPHFILLVYILIIILLSIVIGLKN